MIIVEILKNIYSYNSFLPIRWILTYKYTNLRKHFNFFFIFYFFNLFSYTVLKYFKKVKKKFVVLRSPFHFKTSKHILCYKYYTIKCIFYTIYKYIFICKHILTNFFYLNQISKTNITTEKSLKLSDLIKF